MARHRIIDELVENLFQLVEQSSDGRLPSIAELSFRWGVSYPTAAKAVRVLVEQGKIECFHGRRIQVSRKLKSNTQAGTHGNSRERQLLDAYRTQILDGRLICGNPMPKVTYLVLTQHVSRSVVIRVLRGLEHEHLVHKEGKQWIIGPAQSPVSRGSTSQQPRTILIASPYQANVDNLFVEDFTSRFILRMNEELLHFGIQERYLEMRTADPDVSTREKALHQAEGIIRKLGDRYLGALIHRGAHQKNDYAESMDSWTNLLGNTGKPAVFFDSSGTGQSFTRKRYPGCPAFYRLSFDHFGAVKCAVDVLVRNSHRIIGFPLPYTSPWVKRRARFAALLAGRSPLKARVVQAEQNEPFWTMQVLDRPNDIYDRIIRILQNKGEAASEIQSRHRLLLDFTPSFRKLLDNQVTAIISANDLCAFEHYRWLTEAGIQVPRHMSMVSFDNLSASVTRPISTVDLGFARLGYLAAHLFFGDIPIRCDSEGNIQGECTFLDRGSIAPPRKP